MQLSVEKEADGTMPGSGPRPLTKADYEAFRVERFGQPVERATAEDDGMGGRRNDSSQDGDEGDHPGADDEGDLTADCSRVILHFDAGESGGCVCLGRLLRVRLFPVSRLLRRRPPLPAPR